MRCPSASTSTAANPPGRCHLDLELSTFSLPPSLAACGSPLFFTCTTALRLVCSFLLANPSSPRPLSGRDARKTKASLQQISLRFVDLSVFPPPAILTTSCYGCRRMKCSNEGLLTMLADPPDGTSSRSSTLPPETGSSSVRETRGNGYSPFAFLIFVKSTMPC